MVLVAFLGYASTCHTRSVLVKVFIASLVLVTCVIIFVDVVVFTQPELTRDVLNTLWPQLNDHGRIQFQKLLHCCDVTTATMHGNNTTATRRWASSYHASCFEEEGVGVGDWVGGSEHHGFQRRLGCFDVVVRLIHDNLYLISGIIGAIVTVNVLLVLLSFALLVTDDSDDIKTSRRYSSFPVVTDVVLWKRRQKIHFKQNVSGIFELPPTYPTEPILQAYKNSIEKSMKFYE